MNLDHLDFVLSFGESRGRRDQLGCAASITLGQTRSPTENQQKTKGKGCWLMSSITANRRGAALDAAGSTLKCNGSGRFHQSEAKYRPSTRSAGNSSESESRFSVLHEIFEEQADARPEAVAVVFGREETTYLELESRANRLARHLGARGVRRGSLVAMLLPRSVDADREALKAERCERLPRDLVRAGPRDLCYVIT